MGVREALGRCHGGKVTPEQPPRGEHKANGAAEEAGRTVRDQARVLKLQMETRIGRKIALEEPITPWLIRWAAMSVSRSQVGKDGNHPYERQRGRKCNPLAVPFGETVLFRMPEVANDQHQALDERWCRGIWIGHARDTGETLVADEEGVRNVWAVRRMPEEQQWDGERIRRIKGSLKNWRIDAGPEEEMRADEKDRKEEKEEKEEFPEIPMGTRTGEKRSLYLRKEDFVKYGFTPGCRGCMDIASGKQRAVEALAPHTRASRCIMDTCVQESPRDGLGISGGRG